MAISAFNGVTVDDGSTILGISGLSHALGFALDAGGGGDTLLHYKFNAGSGTVLAAEAGPDGTTNAGWATGAAGSGSALNFNGSTHGALTDSAVVFGTNVITVRFWLDFDNAFTFASLVESYTSANPTADACFAITLENNEMKVYLQGTSGALFQSFDLTAFSGFHHYAIVLDNSTGTGVLKAYFDGSPVSWDNTYANTKTGTSNFATAYVFFGARDNAGSWYDGRMDNLAIYAGELSGAEIAAIYTDESTNP